MRMFRLLRLWLARKLLPRDLLVVDRDAYDGAVVLVERMHTYVIRSGHMNEDFKSHERLRLALPMAVGALAAARDLAEGA